MPPAPSPRAPRSSERYGIALPITMEGEECATHDLSATGVLMETGVAQALGAPVALRLQFTARGRERELACQGQVVRVERHGDGYNIAVRLDEPLFAPEAAAPRTA